MALRGDLASVDLAQVFQMLALNKKAGLLSIQSAKLWKVLYFDHRGVTVHHNVHRVLDRVVAAMVRCGRLTEAAVDEVRDHAARMGQPLADSLLAGGYLQSEELEDQYRLELEEEIYDLFFCRDAKFEFHEGVSTLDGRDGTVDERFFSNCDSVIMEAARRIDEWTYISERVPTTAEVLVATAETIDPEAFGADGPAVFELLDGRRNVARIVELTGSSTFLVCKSLSQMLEASVIAQVAVEELLPLATECLNGGRLQDAINLYERAIEFGIGLPEVHSAAAGAYRAAEQYENAIYHLECEAEHRLGTGDRSGAAQRLLEAKQLVPTDLQARERLVELTLGPGGVALAGFDPLAEGKELVDLLLEFGDIARVRLLLERLLLVEPHDPDLKKALVNVHVKAGDQKRVAELYESIADDLVRQQKPLEAIAYLQKILLIDRARTDISERVRSLYEFDEHARRRGRALSVLAVLFCLLLVLGSGYWFYNERAEEDFARIDVRESLQHEDFAAAISAYTGFIAEHPFATSVGRAKAELQQAEAARQRFEARLASERASRELAIKGLRAEYAREWQKHRELFLGGDPEGSLKSLGRVKQLVEEAGTPDDMAWGLEQQVERTWVRLREFIAESEQLGAKCQQHMAAGEWQAARTIALQLHKDFDNTQAARAAQLPVMVTSRPPGAEILLDGVVLQRTVGNQSQPVQTPAVVLLPYGASAKLAVQRAGFEPRELVVDAGKTAEVEVVLAVIARQRVTFDAPVQTGIGIGDGWLAVGLRGGRLGIARTDGSSSQVRELGGLKAVDSAPSLQGGRVFFTTNENTIECLAVDSAVPVTGWPVALGSGAATELMVDEGRVAVVDRDGVLHCFEQASGRRLWSVSLDGQVAGAPTIDRRQLHVGTTDGRVLVFDAADGQATASLRSPAGLSTRVLADRGLLCFGGQDGNLRMVDMKDGRVIWTESLGRAPSDGSIALTGSVVIAAASGNRLMAFDRLTGASKGTLTLDGELLAGIRVHGNRGLVQLRRAKSRARAAHDILVAIDVGTMNVQWEFAQEGLSPGLPGIDASGFALPCATGEVVLFR